MSDAVPGGDGAALGPTAAQLLAWVWVMALNAVWIEVGRQTTSSLEAMLLHHFYDAGQLAAIALCVSALAWLWLHRERWLALRRWQGYSLLFLAGWALAFLTFDDVRGFIQRQLPWPDAPFVFPLLTMLGGVSLVLAVAVGALLNRRYVRWLVALGCTAVVLANQSVLIYEYAGPHLLAVVSSATALGAAYAGLRLPDRLGPHARRAGARATTLLAVVALVAVVAPPPPSIALRLFQTPGAVLAPFSTVFYRDRLVDDVPPADGRYAAWLVPRRGRADVEPGPQVVLRTDMIVVLLTVDALRADVVGSRRHVQLLPEIEAMRQRSVTFTLARTVAPKTHFSIASLFTGLYPAQFDRNTPRTGPRPYRVCNDTPYLALPHTPIRAVHVYDNPAVARAHALGFKETIEKQVDLGTDVAKVLREHRHGPLLVYAHFMEPHAPYGGDEHAHLPPYQRYLREVALVDRQLRQIRTAIQQSEKRDRTVLILSADHGEAFGEHGFNYHSKTLYEEMVRVPLLIEVAGVAPREVANPVSTIDLAPTVLDLFGLSIPGHLMGQSLAGFLLGEDPVLDRPIALQNSLGLSAMVFPDGYKAIYDEKRKLGEVYDLDADPGEEHNLLEDPSSSKHLGTLIRFFAAHRRVGAGTGGADDSGE